MLGYVNALDSQSTTTIVTPTTTMGSISITVAGVYAITIIGILKVTSLVAANATMTFGGISEIGFGVVSGDASGYYQFANTTNLIKVSANYTSPVTVTFIGAANTSQVFLRYNYVRIA